MNILENIEKHAALLHALGHPVRFCIVEQLIKKESNVNGMVNCLNVAQPTISQHLQLLKSAGIIEGRREGKEMIYHAVNKDAINVIEALTRDN